MISSKWDLSRSAEKIQELEERLRNQSASRITILCHNNPDPDTIASAYAFDYLLAKKFGVRSFIRYGGVITRAENKAMVKRLQIKMLPLERINDAPTDTLALIDAQPATGNNLILSRDVVPFIVIDHHPSRRATHRCPFHDIRPLYGSTSTIITEYYAASGLTPPRSVANALLYGLKTDTGSLVRTSCKADFRAFSFLSPYTNPRVLGWIEKPPLPQSYFEDYCKGLAGAVIYKDVAVSYIGAVESEAIVPELADVLLRIDHVSWSLCMGLVGSMLVISLRARSRKHKAGAILRKLVGKAGSAGGHREMAGGVMPVVGMADDQIKDLGDHMIEKFLTLIDRKGHRPEKLVHEAWCRLDSQVC